MTSFPQTADLTNAETSEQTGSVLMGVPWSSGEMPNIATLRAGYRVQIGATTYPTHWHSRGMPYATDAGVESLRMTYAVFRPTMAAGSVNPITPQFTPTVVAADNTGTSAASFAAWASNLNITVAYHDWLADVNVSADVAALARAGLNASTEALERNAGRDYYRVQDEGGQRTITYSAWIGPGRRHEPIRSLGHNNSGDYNSAGALVTNPNLAVARNGLLQVLVTIKILDQDAHATIAVALMNGASYPYPSAPMDGGTRRVGQPDRPTHLDPTATNPYTGIAEQLESSLQRHIEDLTITIAHASTAVYSRPWYVNNHTSGAGPFGTLITDGNETSIPLEGLADRQGWGFRLTVSATSANDAAAKARRPYTFLATPTYQTWLNTTWERTFTGTEVGGDTCTMRGWWTFSLPNSIPASTILAWRTRNNTAGDVAFMNQTRSSPWHILAGGYGDEITGWERGSKHLTAGNLHEGEAMLAGCHEFIYKMGAIALRQNTAKIIHLEHAALHSLDTIRATSGGDRRNCYFEGTHIGNSSARLTYQSFGRHRASWDVGPVVGSNFNGSICPADNPDPTPNASISDGPDWAPHKGGTHIGARSLYQYDLLTDDKMSRFLLTKLGHYVPLMQPCRGPFYGSSPTSSSARGELRPVWLGEMAVLRSDDAEYRDRVLGHMVHRALEWRRVGATAVWPNPGAATNGDRNIYRGKPCGVPPYDIDNAPQLMQWWLIGQVDQFVMMLAMMAPAAADAASIAFTTSVMSKACVDFGWWIDTTRIPAASVRTFDTCWTSNRLLFGAEQFGYVSPKHSVPDRDNGTVDVVRMLNLHQDIGISNAAQIAQQYPALDVSMVFARNRNAAGHTDRVEFLKSVSRAVFPQLVSGDDYSDSPQQHLGFLCGESYIPSGGGLNPPQPTFTVSTRAGVVPLSVTLNPAASVINGTVASASYQWWDHFVEGSTPSATGTGFPISRNVTYANAGLYRPGLRITQSDGQIRTFVDQAGIDARNPPIPAPDPFFTASPLTRLPTEQSQFTYIERGGRALTYVWQYKISTEPTTWTTFGSGARDPLWTAPATAGTYDFRVTATNETGNDTHTETAYITVSPPIPPPVPSFVPSSTGGTAPLTVTFDASASTYTGAVASTQWEWWDNYVQGASPDETIMGASGATYEATYSTTGRKQPALRLTQADTQAVRFVYSAGILVSLPGTAQPPVPSFTVTPTTILIGIDTAAISYIDLATRATSYVWSYRHEDSTAFTTFSTERNPVWTPPELLGAYDIRVVSSNEYGASQPFTLTTAIHVVPVPAPVATFTPDETSGEDPLTVNFDASASTYYGDLAETSWHWYADIGSASPTEIIDGALGATWQRIYSTPGTYYPKLILIQEDGQESEFVFKDGIVAYAVSIPAPDPLFTVSATSVLTGADVAFTYIERGGRALTYLWEYKLSEDADWIEFGDGARDPVWEAVADEGIYDFRVTATNETDDATTTVDGLITVNAPLPSPKALFTASAAIGTAPFSPTLDGSGSTLYGDPDVAVWQWWDDYNPTDEPDDETTGPTGATYQPTYGSAGTTRPALRLVQEDGQPSLFIFAAGIVTQITPIADPPSPEFSATPSSVVAGESVSFQYVEYGLRALTYLWEYEGSSGDWVEFSSLKNPTWVTPIETELYSIRVTATNEYGSATKTKVDLVSVRLLAPPPVATFTPDETSGAYPLTVIFDASASTASVAASLLTWRWFADSLQEDPTEIIEGAGGDEWEHEYELPGVYHPMLELLQPDGQIDRYIYEPDIVVTTDPGDPPAGTIEASATTVDPGQIIQLTWVDSGVASYAWEWSYRLNGASDWISISSPNNPAEWEVPRVAGAYDVQCEATNSGGTTTKESPSLVTVVTNDPPVAAFTLEAYSFGPRTPGYPSATITVATNDTTGEDVSYEWAITPGSFASTDAIPDPFTITGRGDYRLTLRAENANGISFASKTVSVLTGRESTIVYDPSGRKTRTEFEQR
jgi:PKD repeat protein